MAVDLMFFPIIAPPVSSLVLSFHDSAISAGTTTTSCAVPGTVIAGDVLVFFNRSDSPGGTPSDAIPSGFTVIQQTSVASRKHASSYKLAVGTEAGTNLSGLTASGGAAATRGVLLVFRGSKVIAGVTLAGGVGVTTDADPAAQNIAASSGVAPLVVVAGFFNQSLPGNAGSGGYSSTPAMDATVDASDRLRAAYKIYNSSPADHSIDTNDGGVGNGLHGAYLQCT